MTKPKSPTVRRTLETGGGGAAGSIVALQIVAVLTEVFESVFTAYPSLEALAITTITALVTVLNGWYWSWRGIERAKGNGESV